MPVVRRETSTVSKSLACFLPPSPPTPEVINASHEVTKATTVAAPSRHLGDHRVPGALQGDAGGSWFRRLASAGIKERTDTSVVLSKPRPPCPTNPGSELAEPRSFVARKATADH
ncbi:hypothetical protein BaRGS_00029539 [Batillaria attramentaria]|uniref:Uncharacterized protein n=1 Tax=Batillaria attramentaria TaxID=370345 RepID=A0ABD0JVU8_9CAEN